MDPLVKTSLALALDAAAGEPPNAVHPVRWMGHLISVAELAARALARTPERRRKAGAIIAFGLPLSVFVAAQAALRTLPRRLRFASEISMLAASIAVQSLARAATKVDSALESGIEEGRGAVAHMVGRDTAGLDEDGVVRATVESVAENCNDGVIAPLFYGLVGGGPMALSYRMINTLDSMVGYRDERYRDLGYAAARLDDAAGFVPARITALAAAAAAPLVGGSGLSAIRTWRRDASGHASPNAGVCEAAFAGALGVRLGGTASYGGRVSHGGEMGQGNPFPRRADIARAVTLMKGATVVFMVMAVSVRLSAGLYQRGR